VTFKVFVLALLLARSLLAAVAVAESTSSPTTGTTIASASSTGVSFNNATGTVLYACLQANSAGGNTTDVTAASYNGVAMTLVGKVRYDTNAVAVSLWRLLSPTVGTGAHPLTFTITSTALNRWIAGAISFTGNDTSTPDSTPSSCTSASGTPTTNLNSCINSTVPPGTAAATITVGGTTAGNFLVDCAATGTGGMSSNTTQIWKSSPDSGANGGDNGASSRAAGGGSIIMSYAVSTDIWAIAAVEVRQPAAAPPPATSQQGASRLILRNGGTRQ
jgi:hypothetical protein